MEPSDMIEVTDIIKKTEETLDNLWKKFELFCPKCLHFKMGQCISVLLQHEYLLESDCEVINSIFLLCQMGQPQELNPFNRIIFNYVNQKPVTSKVAAASYLINLLPFSQSTLSSTTSQVLQNVKSIGAPLKNFPYSPKPDCSLPIIVDDPENDSKDDQNYKEVLSQLFGKDIPDSVFIPPLVRPPPPLYSEDDDDLVWLCPNDTDYSFAWQPCISDDKDKPGDVKKLFALAQRQSLETRQYERLKEELHNKDECLPSLSLSPTMLPKLVDKNPSLAVDLLLLTAQSQQFGEYLTSLINMDLSLHSMEVVNKITANLELPPQFIHYYIRNCITNCTEITDKNTQHRFVRLVCVFLTALIRNRLVNVQDILIEIQAFCIDHSRIREATGLFRLLKSLDTKE